MTLIQWTTIITVVVFMVASYQTNAHEIDKKHVHCSDPGVNCKMEEDIVRGYWIVTPNSSPTPYTGGNSPTNSTSDNCEGSGCINYEESYNPYGTNGHYALAKKRGESCVTKNGVRGVYAGLFFKAYVECFPDTDGDGIADRYDDCVFDSTNSNVECLDDLPDCDELVAYGLTAVSGAATTGSVLTVTIKGVVVGKAVVVTGGAIVLAGGAYCAVAWLEG